MNNEKCLYIIAGANGSGKSTYTDGFLKEKNLVFLNADNIAKVFKYRDIEHFKKLKTEGKFHTRKVFEYLANNDGLYRPETLVAVERVIPLNRTVELLDVA